MPYAKPPRPTALVVPIRRFHRSDLHFTRNRARADVQRTTENEWETQHIVHLIGVIRASRRDNRVWTNLFDQFRQNFRALD